MNPLLRNRRATLVALFFALLFASRIVRISDQDAFFHARCGWWMLENHRIPRTDPFSVFAAGEPWINHQWLAQIAMALASARPLGGLAALSLARAALLTLSFALIWAAARKRGAGPWPCAAAISLGAIAAWRYSEPRPYIATYCAMAYMAWAWSEWRAGRRTPYRLMPMPMAAWANFHGGFYSGLAYGGALAAGWSAERLLRGLRGGARLRFSAALFEPWLILAGMALAACLNPHGIALYTFPFKVIGAGRLEEAIMEWNAPSLEYDFWPYYLYAALLGLAFIFRPRSYRAEDWLAVGGFLWMSLNSRRHIPLLIYASAPILAAQFEAWGRAAVEARRPRFARFLPALALAALIALEAAWARRMLALDYIPLGFGPNPVAQPIEAADFLARSSLARPNLFHGYNNGGYLFWRLDTPWRPFVDGRIDLYGPERVELFYRWITGKADWRGAFAQYGIQAVLADYALAEIEGGLVQSLRDSPEWALAHWDDQDLVYLKRDPAGAEALARAEYRFADPTLNDEALRAIAADPASLQALLDETDRRLSENPGCIRALDLKSRALLERGDSAGAAQTCREIVALDPRAFAAQYRLARLLDQAGRLEEAATAYRAALRHRPNLAYAWTRLGAIAEQRGDLKSALRLSVRALRSDPANAESVYYAGHVRYALGDLAGAILHFEHYLSLKPGDSATRENLALLHEQSGRPAEARRLRSGAPQ